MDPSPPRYPSFKKWTREMVADWVKTLGSGGDVWAKYAQAFFDNHLDGFTLLSLTAEDLIQDYKLAKPHANALVKEMQTLNEPESSPSVSLQIPITEQELTAVQEMQSHYAQSLSIGSGIAIAETTLTEHANAIREAVTRRFATLQKALDEHRDRALTQLSDQEEGLKKELQDFSTRLEDLKGHEMNDMKQLQDLFTLKVVGERRKAIMELRSTVLSRPVPRITEMPSLKVVYTDLLTTPLPQDLITVHSIHTQVSYKVAPCLEKTIITGNGGNGWAEGSSGQFTVQIVDHEGKNCPSGGMLTATAEPANAVETLTINNEQSKAQGSYQVTYRVKPGCTSFLLHLSLDQTALPSSPLRLSVERPPHITLVRKGPNIDEHGLFYWLGSIGKTKPWVNPLTNGACVVTVSSQHPSYPAHNIAGRSSSSGFFMSEGKSGDWFCIDTRIKFSLREYSFGYFGYSCKLKVESSSDGSTWDVVGDHDTKGGVFSHIVDPPSPVARYFRFTQSEKQFYLWGLELYGALHIG